MLFGVSFPITRYCTLTTFNQKTNTGLRFHLMTDVLHVVYVVFDQSLPRVPLILKSTVRHAKILLESFYWSLLPLHPFTCPLPPTSSSLSHRTVASFPRASLGCSRGGWGQPSGDLMSKAGGGNWQGGRRGWRKVQEFQHSHAHTAAACEHAGGCDPFVTAWVVLLNGVETWAAIITSHCV